MRRSALPLLLALLVACGEGSAGDRPSGGVEGFVTIGPQCPVLQEGSPCPDAPFAARVQILEHGNVVAAGRSGDDGSFRIAVEPGNYTLHAEPLEPNGLMSAQEVAGVTVPADAFIRVDIAFDSGIR